LPFLSVFSMLYSVKVPFSFISVIQLKAYIQYKN
jgi:hypothetical protein